jgi:predicted transcriptional regulator
MAKYKEKPRYNVISMRVNDKERKTLQAIASCNSISISAMMRQAMERFTVDRERARQTARR